MQSLATQLPLGFNSQQVYQLSNFYFSRVELQQALIEFCGLATMDFLYLWGNRTLGKSHLLIAMMEQAQQAGKRAAYLPLAELVITTSPAVLQSLEKLDLLCIDDLETIAGSKKWEEAIFHCFNRLQHAGCQLVIASTSNPAMTNIQLADLRSRLATGLIYQLESLNDAAKQQALIIQAQSRGLEMPDEVAQYLLRHHSRDMRELMQLLQLLDKASMIQQRRLTIPFVGQTLLSV